MKLTVHGSIFFLLKKFVISQYSDQTWQEILKSAGHERAEYTTTQSYPLSEMGSLISAASKLSGKSIDELKERFGEYMVPDLFVLYKDYLQPNWKTFDVLENTERVFHGAVRQLNSTAHPPVLSVTHVNPKVLMIDYYSKRRMGLLAIGIIKGIASYYKESDALRIIPLSNPDDERVQIRVEYK